METPELPVLILLEGLFLSLVVAVVLLFIRRRESLNNRALLDKMQTEISALQSQLKQCRSTQKNSQTREEGQHSQQLKDSQLKNQETTKSAYKKRIANLEKFKELYFSLEKQVETSSGELEHGAKKIQVLQGIIDTQNQLIGDLKNELRKLSELHDIDGQQVDNLLNTIQQLENNSAELQEQLNHVKRQRLLAELDSDKLNQYKERVEELERVEKRLKRELEIHLQQSESLKQQLGAKAQHGTVRVREIENLSHQLAKRDDEIRRLRQECDTIALQYEELAMRSMEIAGASDNLSDEQKALLEELKQQLEDNSAELSRKRAECEMLENCYMELQQQSTEANQTTLDMEKSFREHDDLAGKQRKIGKEIASFTDPKTATELTDLRETLTSREQALEKVRADYREIKQQFIEIAQDEAELRETNKTLKAECTKLKNEINLIQQSQPDSDTSEELAKLQAEYNKLEARYLALLENSNP